MNEQQIPIHIVCPRFKSRLTVPDSKAHTELTAGVQMQSGREIDISVTVLSSNFSSGTAQNLRCEPRIHTENKTNPESLIDIF